MQAHWVLSDIAPSLPVWLQDVWIHVVTFVLCAATVACGGYRLHGEYNNNVAQTLSILVRDCPPPVPACTLLQGNIMPLGPPPVRATPYLIQPGHHLSM